MGGGGNSQERKTLKVARIGRALLCQPEPVLECVVNVSEGRSADVIRALADAAGDSLIDLHSDRHHHRSVLTLCSPDVERAAQALAEAALASVDIRLHQGVHPRLGALDVVPFVPLPRTGSEMTDAVAARDRFAAWAGRALALPCFLYGPERSLPEVRRAAFRSLDPDTGPARPHPSAGATAVGARRVLVAYNLWLARAGMAEARQIAVDLRGPAVRALAFDIGGVAQVSCNLLDPAAVGPDAVFDRVTERAELARAELVGLVPEAVLRAVPRRRWAQIGLSPDATIESRLGGYELPGPGGG